MSTRTFLRLTSLAFACIAGCDSSTSVIRSGVTEDEVQVMQQTQRTVEAEERAHQQKVFGQAPGR